MMLNKSQLESLPLLSPPVLTAYLHIRRAEASLHGFVPEYQAWLRKKGKSIAKTLPLEQQDLFLEQLARTEEFLRNRKPHETSLVIFAGFAVWEIVSLPLEVENELHWGKPSLSQLLWIAGEHRPCGVVLVDRARARFFKYWLGEMIEFEEKRFAIDISQWKKKELGHVTGQGVEKTRGSQRDVFEHRMDAQYAHLCRETAQRTTKICEKEGLTAVFLVGSDRLIKPIKTDLQLKFRQPIVLLEQDLARISPLGLRKHIEPKIAEWERGHEVELVTDLLASERGAVAGFDETLVQLQKGKIRTVVLVGDLDESLRQCVRCGWVDRSADPVCPTCGGERRAATLRDVLPELAGKYKADVEVVSGEAAKRLKQAGGMGAWLRQPKRISASRGS